MDLAVVWGDETALCLTPQVRTSQSVSVIIYLASWCQVLLPCLVVASSSVVSSSSSYGAGSDVGKFTLS